MEVTLPFSFDTPKPREIVIPGVSKPVAQVVLDTNIPGLSRTLDYLIPKKDSELYQPGCLVRVDLAGQVFNAYIISRSNTSEYFGTLKTIRTLVSPLPILDLNIWHFLNILATHYGSFGANLLRFAVPARVGKIEKDLPNELSGSQLLDFFKHLKLPILPTNKLAHIFQFKNFENFFSSIGSDEPAKAVLTVPPMDSALTNLNRGDAWMEIFALCAYQAMSQGQSALLIVPSADQGYKLTGIIKQIFLQQDFDITPYISTYFSTDSNSQRYKNFLNALNGKTRILIGTRNAVYAPIKNLGFIACWDELDSRLRESMAPYVNATTAIEYRSEQEKCAYLLASHAATIKNVDLTINDDTKYISSNNIDNIKLHFLDFEQRIFLTNNQSVHIPGQVYASLKSALQTGPILIQVNNAGYKSHVYCQTCRKEAHCPKCKKIIEDLRKDYRCTNCGASLKLFSCENCRGHRLRAGANGGANIARAFGKAFANTPILVSNSVDGVLSDIDDSKRIIAASLGAAPSVPGGYHACLFLDTNMFFTSSSIHAPAIAMRHLMRTVALTKNGGEVFINPQVPEQFALALSRNDSWSWALSEYEERSKLRFSPRYRIATVSAQSEMIEQVWDYLFSKLPHLERIALNEAKNNRLELVVRVPKTETIALGKTLAACKNIGLARHLAPIYVQVDPANLV